ncbi:MAG: DNA replication and repair protein RecF, partial [Christensenellales bacterium]
MVIKRIRLKNFRNYASADAEFAPGINLVTGSNAQGKTNLLESILLSCVGKSVRGKDKELIRTGCARAFIKMETSRSSGDVTTELVLSRTENKRIAVNGASLQRTSELLGIVGAIYFCPDDLKLVKDAPESRRRFLDLDLSQVYKSYHHALTRYNKALLSRNNILKRYPERQLTDLCYPYDAQLAREGSKIAIMRADYVKLLGEESERVHLQLTSGAEKLETVYQTGADLNPQTAEESYFKKLAANLEKDAKLKFTTFGIHRDDLKLSVDG